MKIRAYRGNEVIRKSAFATFFLNFRARYVSDIKARKLGSRVYNLISNLVTFIGNQASEIKKYRMYKMRM